jgi:spermidine/putrescine-binding protein
MNPFPVRNTLLAVITSIVFFALPTRAAPDRAHIVNVYAWADYYPQSVVEKFQAETGLHVNRTVFDSPDVTSVFI